MRLLRSLNGTWQFQTDPAGVLAVETLNPERTIPVPMPWQAAFPELLEYSGYAWYRTTIRLDEEWLRGELRLHFGAVDYWCELFVNGERAGEHEGGYTPFAVSIREFARAGENEIALRVFDPVQLNLTLSRWHHDTQASANEFPFPARDIPHGKQEWYLNVGGIWQDVTLTALPHTYISQVHVVPNLASGEAHFKITLGGANPNAENALVHIALEGQEVRARFNAETNAYEARIVIANPRLWTFDDPQLYHADVHLEMGSDADEFAVRFGLREIATREGQLVLNGEPFFLLAALDQDLYPDTIYTVPSAEFLRDEFQKAKQLGLNCLRCHIKPPDPRYLELADEMGLLVWAEIPSWRTFHPRETVHANELVLDDAVKQRVARTLQEMIARDMNHPSLIIWTIVNEDWGTSLPLSAPDRAWVSQMYDFCKSLDPTRLVVDNSACVHAWGPNIHIKSDLDDFHLYANIPDQAKTFEQNMEEFNLRPMWSWSNHGDAQRRGDEPLILSEFGNWGLPSLAALRAHYNGDPMWFDTGPWWSGWEGEPGWARGAQERFHAYGLDAMWDDYEAFALATQWHEFAALKFQIETLRRQPALAGYVITELADIYWESNGLLDFARNPKIFHDMFAAINAPDMLVPEPQHYASWDDDMLALRLYGSHFAPSDWNGARLQWSVAEKILEREREIPYQTRGAVRMLDERLVRVPRVEATQRVRFDFALHDGAGKSLARNWLDLLVLPAHARRAAYARPIAVIAHTDTFGMNVGIASGSLPENVDSAVTPPQPATLPNAAPALGIVRFDLATSLRRIGYQTMSRLDADTEVAVTNLPTAELLRWVREGGRLLFLNNGPSPFFWSHSRGGTYSGNWITSYTWLRPKMYKRLDVPNPIGLPFRHVMPLRTILGLPVEDAAIHQDLLAGMISGWVRHPATHTVQFRYGRGRVIMTTFAFEESLNSRPAAIALLHDLIDHLVSDACDPVLRANY